VDNLSRVFLGVLALASLVQALVVLAIALAGRKLARDLAEVKAGLGKTLEPVADDVRRVARNAADITDTVAAQGRRMDRAVGATTASLQDTAEYVGRAVRTGVRPLIEVGALWQGVKQALRVYRSLRPSPRGSSSSGFDGRGATPLPRERGGPHDVWEERQSGATDH
jgi:hypothetical protein